ncbi:MAG: tetratricopeptide repeat protein [Acidobacteriota bacterium]
MLLVCLAGVAGYAGAQTSDGPRAERILVMPFENVKREGAIFWLGEASAVLLTDDLIASGRNAITRPERQLAFERLQVPAAAALTDATVIRIAQVVGATQVIVGSLQMDTGELVVRARGIALEAGRIEVDLTERGPLSELQPLFDRLARRFVGAPPQTAPLDPNRPPVAAFESYIKGLLAETPSTALKYLGGALALDADYAQVRLALWDVYTEQGDHARAMAAVRAVSESSPLSRRARFLAGISQISLRKFDDAFATFQALAKDRMTPAVANSLGVIQVRRAATPQAGAATYYFDKATQGDPDDPDYVFNLGYAYWLERDPSAAIYWLREAVRRNPADGAAHFILGAALAAAGNAAESVREKELARRLSSTYEQWDKRPAGEQIPKGLERLKTHADLPHARRIETTIASSGQRDQQDLAAFYLDRARRLFQQEHDRDAVAELERALYLSPYLSDAHVLLGRIHLRNGRPRDAIDALKIAVWSRETAEAHILLGTAYKDANEPEAARAEAERALVLEPSSAEAKALLDMLRSP